MYTLDVVLQSLKNNKDVSFEGDIPSCPIEGNGTCEKITENCPQGNSRKCVQRLVFFVNKNLFILYPKFFLEKNTKEGFFKDSDLTLKRLINDGIIVLKNIH